MLEDKLTQQDVEIIEDTLKTMNTDNRIPYVYRIKRKDTGEFYYGSKYGKDANPDKFWVKNGYFTSSKTIKKIIEFFGSDIFETKIIRICKTKKDAFYIEKKLIDRTIKSKKSLNGHSGGTSQDTNKGRKIKDPMTGLSSYDIAGIKCSQYYKNNPHKLIERSKKMSKTLMDNPEILKNSSIKRTKTISTPDSFGKTIKDYMSENFKGDKNPSKNPENKKKISEGVKKWIKDNPEKVQAYQEKTKKSMIERDCYEQHSKWMLENNPTRNTIWVNNGKENTRVNKNEIPDGFIKGRLKNYTLNHTEMTCPHCNKIGKGPNMKRYHFDNCKLIKL